MVTFDGVFLLILAILIHIIVYQVLQGMNGGSCLCTFQSIREYKLSYGILSHEIICTMKKSVKPISQK